MAQVNVSKDEAQLLAVYRAIQEANTPYVQTHEVGDVLGALREVGQLESREKDLSAAQIKVFIAGFVAGIAATRVGPEAPEQYLAFAPDEYTEFIGEGPSGGVAVGQGEDPRYVAQTGPRADQEEG